MSDLDLTEAVDAPARDTYEAARRRYGPEWPVWKDADPVVKMAYREHVLPTVAAAAPHIERAVRAQIAAQIVVDTHDPEKGIPFDDGFSVGVVGAWIEEWFLREDQS